MKNHFAKLCRSRDQEIKNLKGEHRNLWRAFPRNPRGEFVESKKSNQRSLMIKFTASIQSLTAAVLNTWLNLSWEVNRPVIGLRWSCRLIADQRLIVWDLRLISFTKDFVKIQNRPGLKKTRAILKVYNDERVFPKGEVYLDIQIGGKITSAKFLVIDDAPSSPLSGKHVRSWNSCLLKENYSSTQFLAWKGRPRMLFCENTTMYSLD